MQVVVHVDGGARGNPGPAAVAAVASTPDGDVVGERNEYIGEATNNVAEYRSVLLALELARELGANEVEIVNDSELVARQIGRAAEDRVNNGHRVHAGLKGSPPESIPDEGGARASIRSYRWHPHCRGLYQTPTAA